MRRVTVVLDDDVDDVLESEKARLRISKSAVLRLALEKLFRGGKKVL